MNLEIQDRHIIFVYVSAKSDTDRAADKLIYLGLG